MARRRRTVTPLGPAPPKRGSRSWASVCCAEAGWARSATNPTATRSSRRGRPASTCAPRVTSSRCRSPSTPRCPPPGSASSTAAWPGWSTAASRSRRRPSRRVPTGTCCWSDVRSPSLRTSWPNGCRRSAPVAPRLTRYRRRFRVRQRGSTISPSMASPSTTGRAGEVGVCGVGPGGARTGHRRSSTTPGAPRPAAPTRHQQQHLTRPGVASSSAPSSPTSPSVTCRRAADPTARPPGNPPRPHTLPAQQHQTQQRGREHQQRRRTEPERPTHHHEHGDLHGRGHQQSQRYEPQCSAHLTPTASRRLVISAPPRRAQPSRPSSMTRRRAEQVRGAAPVGVATRPGRAALRATAPVRPWPRACHAAPPYAGRAPPSR